MPRSYNTKIGERFGTRVVISFLKRRDTDGHKICRWQCDCGATGTAGLKAFRLGYYCVNCKPHPRAGHNRTHGHAGGWRQGRKNGGRTHLYDCWANMMQRVRGNGRNKRWYAGIAACDDWQKFEGFAKWALANGYRPGLSLDRIYTCRGYEPGNCEWVTKAENTRRSFEKWRNHDTTPIEMLWGTV